MVAPLSWVCAHDAEAGCEKVTKAKPREWLVILSRMTCACREHAVRGNGQCHEAPWMSTQAKIGCVSAMKARPHEVSLPTTGDLYDRASRNHKNAHRSALSDYNLNEGHVCFSFPQGDIWTQSIAKATSPSNGV